MEIRAMLIVLVVLATLVAASIALSVSGVAPVRDPGPDLRRADIAYEHDGVPLRGYLVHDASLAGPRPGILVVHEWWGLNEYAKRRADMLAELGYVAFACDVFGGEATNDPAVAGQRARRFYDDRALFRARLRKGLERLIGAAPTDPDRLGAIGYCFGGTAVLELARDGAPLSAVVCFHGGLGTPSPDDDANIKAMVLVCNGAADPLVPMDQRQAFIASMEKHRVDHQFIEYGGALHAFTNPAARARPGDENPASGYHRPADARSWEHMKAWLAEAFAE